MLCFVKLPKNFGPFPRKRLGQYRIKHFPQNVMHIAELELCLRQHSPSHLAKNIITVTVLRGSVEMTSAFLISAYRILKEFKGPDNRLGRCGKATDPTGMTVDL
jgi:hypothetical protein